MIPAILHSFCACPPITVSLYEALTSTVVRSPQVRQEDFDGGDVEWRRDLQHQLHQLLTSRELTTRYCLYHLLSLLADTASLALTLLYIKHFNYLHINLVSLLHLDTTNITNSFTNISCDDNKFICSFSNSHIFFWFGALSALIFLLKALVNIRGLGEIRSYFISQ